MAAGSPRSYQAPPPGAPADDRQGAPAEGQDRQASARPWHAAEAWWWSALRRPKLRRSCRWLHEPARVANARNQRPKPGMSDPNGTVVAQCGIVLAIVDRSW